jgi:hypothetical protein
MKGCLDMKKLLALVVSFFMMISLSASDEATVKKVLDDFFTCIAGFDGTGVMKLLHTEFVDEDDEGKAGYDEMKEYCGHLDMMGSVLKKTTAPDATLLDVVTGIFSIQEEKLTDDKIKAVKEMENTPEGKKLKAEYVSALQEMKKMSIEETMAEARSVKIDSIKIDGNTARMVFTVTVDGVLEYNVWDLVKVDGRCLLKKTRSSKSSAIIDR